MQPRRGPAKQRPGVALGVLGIMMLVFTSLVFMMGRPTYTSLYEDITHRVEPFSHNFHERFERMEHDLEQKLDTLESGLQPFENKHIHMASLDPDTILTEIQRKKPQQVEEVQAEQKPAEQKPVVQKPVEQKPVIQKPAEQKPAEVKPVEQKPAEQKPAVKPGTAVATQQQAKPADRFTPTVEMVKRIAQDGYLVVTWANYHYLGFTLSWVEHVKACGVTGYTVGAMDDQILEELDRRGINTFSMKSGLTLGDFGWGSKTFAKMGRQKIRLVELFLELGAQVIIADVDVVWLRNPIPYFQRYPEADILTSSDHLSNTVNDESLERWPEAASAANIGIMLFRKKGIPFVKEWIEIIEKDENVWDQNAFNDLFRRGVRNIEGPNPKNYFMGDNGKLKMGILPVSVFCSGHTYFVQRMADRLKLQVYAVHATFQFSGTPGKRNRMRERLLWHDPPAYFDFQPGFVTFNLDVPAELLKNAGPRTKMMNVENSVGHFELVNHQITQIRNMLAIATMTKRAIIVPDLWCGLDRWWAPHSGTIPGSHFELPFRCPLDHVFDLEGGWAAKMPEEEFGPHIEFREHSFLANHRLPVAVNQSKVVVEMCPPGTAGCSDGTAPAAVEGAAPNQRVRVQQGLDSAKLTVALSNVGSSKLLEFTTMHNAFTRFTDEAQQVKFFKRTQRYTSIWCCAAAHPGHIHYDMWWDTPHVDKFGRTWDKWKPTTGP